MRLRWIHSKDLVEFNWIIVIQSNIENKIVNSKNKCDFVIKISQISESSF
jgi:hypothetical protein